MEANHLKENGLAIAAIFIGFSAAAYTFYSDVNLIKRDYQVKISIDSLKHRITELEEINTLNNKKIKHLQLQHPGSENKTQYK